MDPVVVRFAPSPTGPPHVGSLRTALFDWLLARASGGRFILRIDDTDRVRYRPEAETQMLSVLRWLGLDWDEGPDIGGPNAPYRQSERVEMYRETAERLVAEGHAYRPPDSPEVVRLRTPRTGSIAVHDALRGDIVFRYTRVPADPVLLKSDGYPTYHLASVVDDHHMGITHVLRGEEWLPSAPLHVTIFAALGWSPPVYVHLPLVTDESGKKFKKRDPRTVALKYREEGYLPQAMMNYLALLGWHPGVEREIFSSAELVERFSLERLSRSPSIFSEERLRWFNRQHLATLSSTELAALAIPLIRQAYPQAISHNDIWLAKLVELVREELTLLNDVIPAVHFAFEPDPPTPEARKALADAAARPVLTAFRVSLAAVDVLDVESSANLLRSLRDHFKHSHGWGGRAVMFPIRAALTGSVAGPHLADILALLGKAEALRRTDRALSLL